MALGYGVPKETAGIASACGIGSLRAARRCILPLGSRKNIEKRCAAGHLEAFFPAESNEPRERPHPHDGTHRPDDSHGALCPHGAHSADGPHRADPADPEHPEDEPNLGHDVARSLKPVPCFRAY